MLRINIGCGQTPTDKWTNFDNSFSLRLAKIPFVVGFLHKVKLIGNAQFNFINFARKNNIKYGDATKGLPLQNEACEVIYSSHMLEHLDRSGAERFLKEAFRVLCPGGVIRLALPDIKKQVDKYVESGDADSFIDGTHLSIPRPTTLAQKLRLLLVGTRHHQWMYDGRSLVKLLEKHGFVDAEEMPPGHTKISNPEALNLQERVTISVYVEARKPGV